MALGRVDVSAETSSLGEAPRGAMSGSLYAACKEGNVASVEALLSQGVDLHETDQEGQTALFAAVESANLKIVQVLLNHGADASATDHRGQTALFAIGRAIERLSHLTPRVSSRKVIDNSIEIVKSLLHNGASLGATNAAGENALFFILSFFRLSRVRLDEEVCILTEICEYLVLNSRESDLINGRSHTGYTSVHLILSLLSDVLNQELRTDEARVTLKFQSANCLVHLLGAILSLPWCSNSLTSSRDDKDGNTALHLWAALPYPRELTEDDGASLDTIEFDFESVLSTMARDLFSCGAQVNAANGMGETPLHLAQTWSAAKLLLDKGAMPNCTDLHGNTPLLFHIKHRVAKLGQESTVTEKWASFVYDGSVECRMRWQEILNSGMDPWRANVEGATVLRLLLEGYSFDVIKAFFEATSTQPCRKPDGNGEFPLHVICRDSGRSDQSWKVSLIHDLVESARCNVHDVNRAGETALHAVCRRSKVDSISCEIIRCLRSYGARIDTPDSTGQTCYDATVDRPVLRAALQEAVTLVESMQSLFQWSSNSEKHKSLLLQVVRGQNSQQVSPFHFHVDPIGSGAFGHVYAGVDETDGREVAVKRFEKLRMCRPEDRREIKNLLKVSDCQNVVRYLTCREDQHFVYIILELMEGNLKTLLEGQIREEELISLCHDVVRGLSFLHENSIIHRDIKPGNILYNTNPKLHLKLADFGLSMYVTADPSGSRGQTTVMHSSGGTRCWMAPELLKRTFEHSEASDMFACGLLLHYILTGKKHPFHPEEIANKSDFEVQNETTANILHSKLNIDAVVSPEAKDIVISLVDSSKDERPSAVACLRHPLFWTRYKKIQFLCAVANQAEFERPRHLYLTCHTPLSMVEQDLEKAMGSQFITNPWDGRIEQLYDEVTKPPKKSRRYVTTSAVDLVRFVRNTTTHCSELPAPMQKSVSEDFVPLTKFPSLFMHVYRAVCRHGWDKRTNIAVVIEEG